MATRRPQRKVTETTAPKHSASTYPVNAGYFFCRTGCRALHCLSVKIIYTWYDPTPSAPPHQAELIRLWDRSWTARGFITELLTLRHAQTHRHYKPGTNCPQEFALAVRTGYQCNAWFTPPTAINYSLTAKQLRRSKDVLEQCNAKGRCWPRLDFIFGKRFGSDYWMQADIVTFPQHFSMDDILNCGRQLL